MMDLLAAVRARTGLDSDIRSVAVNLFGADVRGLDVPAFLSAARSLFPLLALARLAALLRVRRAWWLLAGVLLANAYVWLETSWPLQRLYALGPSSDRLNNLAMTQAVVAGGPLLRTAQVGHLQSEPFWALVTAVVSGFDPARQLRFYPFYSLFTACGLALSSYLTLRPRREDTSAAWSPWERAVIAGFATLLSSAVNLAIAAAVGAWDLLGRLVPQWRAPGKEALRAAVLAVAAMPFAVPYWWNPARMDMYFAGSLAPIPSRYLEPAARHAGQRGVVLAGDPAAARWMAALTGTRVLMAQDFPAPRDWRTRLDYTSALARGELRDPVAEGARWGVTHIIVTPGFLAENGLSLESLQARPSLRPLVLARDEGGEFVALFTLAPSHP